MANLDTALLSASAVTPAVGGLRTVFDHVLPLLLSPPSHLPFLPSISPPTRWSWAAWSHQAPHVPRAPERAPLRLTIYLLGPRAQGRVSALRVTHAHAHAHARTHAPTHRRNCTRIRTHPRIYLHARTHTYGTHALSDPLMHPLTQHTLNVCPHR